MFRHCAKCLYGLWYLRNKQEDLLMILAPFYRRGNEGLRLAKSQRCTGCSPTSSHNASRWWSPGLSVWNAQFSSVTRSWPTLCDPMLMGSLSPTLSPLSSTEFAQIHVVSVMLSNFLIDCHPLLLLPSVFPSIRVFSSDSALHIRCPKYWRFSFSTPGFQMPISY